MSIWCLSKTSANDFLQRLRTGEINPEKLMGMDSKARREYFSSFLGEKDAAHVNRLFESKLLLKNQQRGIITWAQQMAGLKPEAQNDLISRVNKMTEVLNPENEKAFLEDYASYKLGTKVTPEEAKTISELSQKATQAKIDRGETNNIFGKSTAKDMEYGYAVNDFYNYVNELKGKTAFEQFKRDIKKPAGILTEVSGSAKSLKATLDNSALLRQGYFTMLTHPSIWMRNSLKSFKDIWDTFGGENVMREVNADIYSRKYYENYGKDKVALGVIEEQYPGSAVLEKIPGFGRLHKAAENAFTAFQYRTRADLYDYYTMLAEKSGIETTTGINIGTLVNSLSRRADLGKYEGAGTILNKVFFAPRKLVADWNVLTGHSGKGLVGLKDIILRNEVTQENFMRRQAGINMVKVIGGSIGILAITDAMLPGSIEWDPRSADFGQIKVGNTRFDITGGIRGIPTLAARLYKQQFKSSITGKISDLNTGKFNSKTGKDLAVDFFQNKLSPAGSLVKDWLLGWRDYQGKKISLTDEIRNFAEPLPLTNIQEMLNDPKSAPLLLGIIADGLGVSVNTYSRKKKGY